MLGTFFTLTLKGLRHRPTRSWLTILGVVIGIMLVVMILVLGNGIQKTVSDQLQSFGSGVIIIFPGKETNPFASFIGNQKFHESDILALQKIEGVEYVLPIEVRMLNIEFQGEKKSVMVHGAPMKELQAVMETSQGVRLDSGRWPTSEQANEVVIGYQIANKLFSHPVRLGDELTLKSKRMTIVGTISEVGNQSDDNALYVSMNVFRQVTGTRGTVGSSMVQLKPGADVNLASERIRYELSKQDAVEDFSVITPAKAGELVGGVLNIIELGLVAIAFISLLVGAVGIMNTMYTSVLERTKQIGIMKAIGATNEAILSLFLIESGMIGLIGGIFGTTFGIGAAALVGVLGAYAGTPGLFSFASIDFLGLLSVLLVTFLIGVLSGYLPARQASRLQPAEALRYE